MNEEPSQVEQAITALIEEHGIDAVAHAVEDVTPESKEDQLMRRIWDTMDYFGFEPVLREVVGWTEHTGPKIDKGIAARAISGLKEILSQTGGYFTFIDVGSSR
jgi:hypothetical protein